MSKYNAVLARNSKDLTKGLCGFSHTVAFSHYNNLSAQLPIDKNGNIVSENIKEQAIQCFKNIETVVKSIGHVLDDVVRLTIMTKSLKDIDTAIDVLKVFYGKYKPTLTAYVVKNLPLNASIQIEAVITCGEGTIPNAPQAGDLIKVVKSTTNAPQNDYSSQTVAFSHYNHLSAQLPIDPKTNKLVNGGIEAQLVQSLKNVKSILEGIDVPFDDIVKVNVYTTSIKEEQIIKDILKTFFPDSAIARATNYLPALSINEVAELQLSAKILVEVVVSHGDGTPPQLVEDRHGIVVKHNNTKKAPTCDYSSQTVAFSHYNNISEILPIDLNKGTVVSDNVNEQLEQCLKYLKEIVESIGHKIDDTVKLNIFVKDINSIGYFENVLNKYFKNAIPAGKIIEVANIGKNALVKIDAVVSNAEGTAPEWKK